ncbi:MAG: hypothetical protein AB7K09_16710 [Planctomycetota bacterium]
MGAGRSRARRSEPRGNTEVWFAAVRSSYTLMAVMVANGNSLDELA